MSTVVVAVYAAMGGATATTTVDISETYLTRARANMALNGYRRAPASDH